MTRVKTEIMQGLTLTLLGFHRVTLSSPYRSAMGASRNLSNTLTFDWWVSAGSPFNAGWEKGCRPNESLSFESASGCGEFISASDV